MIPLVKLPEGRVCEYFARFMKEPTLTYEGLDIHSEESKSSMDEFEKLLRENGFPSDEEIVLYYAKGKDMNEVFGLKDDVAYPDDITIVFVPHMESEAFRILTKGSWFAGIVLRNFHASKREVMLNEK